MSDQRSGKGGVLLYENPACFLDEYPEVASNIKEIDQQPKAIELLMSTILLADNRGIGTENNVIKT